MWAYFKVFLANGRYLDLVRFCWRYRREGTVLLRKILLRRSEKLSGGVAGHGEIAPTTGPSREEIIAATKDWQDWQRADLARLKKLRPGQSNVVFVEAQKNRQRPAVAAAGEASRGPLAH